MYTNSRGAAHAYASVSLETSVMAASLDKKADYISQRLLMANLQNDAAMLKEVGGLLDSKLTKVSAYVSLIPCASTFSEWLTP
ncbi:hypothetical protein [Rhodoferax sp. UBA5149]|uniref:hypothetical protein n=1 Tax=Rhodoferax sp. UBA5149 TaxID=1947379 RepID=UPI0025E501E2|nr:hypothetical protein [Rhodoferax sp. UBA5149]